LLPEELITTTIPMIIARISNNTTPAIKVKTMAVPPFASYSGAPKRREIARPRVDRLQVVFIESDLR
jgi:hypothetical protein